LANVSVFQQDGVNTHIVKAMMKPQASNTCADNDNIGVKCGLRHE
jgi:hypothetical protein